MGAQHAEEYSGANVPGSVRSIRTNNRSSSHAQYPSSMPSSPASSSDEHYTRLAGSDVRGSDVIMEELKTARWNIFFLCLAYASCLSMSTLVANLAPSLVTSDKCGVSEAIAPFTLGVLLLGAAISSAPAAFAMEAFGRRAVFIASCGVAAIGAVLGVFAVFSTEETQTRCQISMFTMCFLVGVGQGVGQFYRFAVVEVAGPYPKGTAVSFVILGGVLSAFMGPYGGSIAKNLLAPEFTGSFILLGLLCVVDFVCVAMVKFPSDMMRSGSQAHLVVPTSRKSLRTIFADVDLLLAVSVATLAHCTMMMLMGPVTLAIAARDYSFDQWTSVLCFHFLLMFLPSFVTGSLIVKHGPYTVSMAGGAVFVVAAIILLAGESLWNFWLGMMLTGLGWNFLFNSGTVLLTTCYEPGDAMRVQGINDVIIFGVAGCSELASGFIFSADGWRTLVATATIGVVLELAVLFALRHRKLKQEAEGADDLDERMTIDQAIDVNALLVADNNDYLLPGSSLMVNLGRGFGKSPVTVVGKVGSCRERGSSRPFDGHQTL